MRARVVGARPMDGLAALSLKPSVVEQGVASYADVRPGAVVRGAVASVEDYGVFVAITPSIKRASRLHDLLGVLLRLRTWCQCAGRPCASGE